MRVGASKKTVACLVNEIQGLSYRGHAIKIRQKGAMARVQRSAIQGDVIVLHQQSDQGSRFIFLDYIVPSRKHYCVMILLIDWRVKWILKGLLVVSNRWAQILSVNVILLLKFDILLDYTHKFFSGWYGFPEFTFEILKLPIVLQIILILII